MVPDQATRARTAGRRARDDHASRTTARSEDLHVRSYAHEWAYDLHVAVVDSAGDLVFEADYYLQPGDVESEIGELPPGEYEVRATLDNETRTAGRCRIGTGPDRTAVIEVGNGLVSLTEGLPTR